jgi:hypothetical protein
MLPGFRFLLAALLLSISVLVFGLGAAALLRAAHEEVASVPSRRVPEPIFAEGNEATLAMARTEPETEQDQPSMTAAGTTVEQTPDEPERIAPLTETETTTEIEPTEATSAIGADLEAKPEAPAQADTSSPPPETSIATAGPAVAGETASAAPAEAPPLDESTRLAQMKIATLGGPAVTIEQSKPLASVRPKPAKKPATAETAKKPVQVKRTVQSRTNVQRPRVVRRIVQHPAPQRFANPFGVPFGN